MRQREVVLDIAERIAGMGYALWDERTRSYGFVSKQYARAFGLTPDEYIAQYRSYEDEAACIHPDDRERYEALYRTSPCCSYRVFRRGSSRRVAS
jgi:hypothetical protein